MTLQQDFQSAIQWNNIFKGSLIMARKKKVDAIESIEEKEEPVESPDEAEERAIDHVYDCKKESLDFYEEKFKLFNYYDRLYIRGAAKTNVPYGRANLELPLAFQQVEPFVSQMTETMVGEAPYIEYEGHNEDDDEVAMEITDFTQYQLDTGGFISSWIPWIRNFGKYGTAVWKTVWETDIMEIEEEVEKPKFELQIDPATQQIRPVEVGTEVVIEKSDYKKKDGPCFYNLSLFDFFVPRSASSPDVQKMEWVIHRTYRSLEQLLANPNYKKAHKKIKSLMDSEDDEKELSSSDASNIRDSSKKTSEEQKNPWRGNKKYAGKIEVLEWWGEWKFDKNDSEYKDALIVIAVLEDERILLRCDKNPLKFKFKPFIMANDYSVEGEPYGYGELHHIKGLIEESTALRNARLDVANISLNRVWLVERQAGVNLRELYTAPNKIILTNDLNGIRPMDMGNVTPSSVNELARIDFDIQNTTEIINPRQDVSNVGAAFGGTATGVNFLSSKTNLRLMTKARGLQESFFKPLAMMLNWYNRDFVTDEAYYRVRGEGSKNPYKTLPADAFLTPVDFKPQSSPDKMTASQRKEGLGFIMQSVGQILKIRPNMNMNVEEFVKDMLKYSGFPHAEKYMGEQQTVVLRTANGQMVDQQGKPIQVMQLDETGQPIEQPGLIPQQ